MLKFLGGALYGLLWRLSKRHFMLRRALWAIAGVQWILRRRRSSASTISLRPGETLQVSLRSKNGQ